MRRIITELPRGLPGSLTLNSVVVLPEEIVSPGSALIEGARASYLYEFHELRAGLDVRASCLGGSRGHARVTEASPKRVCLELKLSKPPLAASPTTLIVAVPRPQTVKKVIQAASMLGVEAMHFVPSEKSPKSYVQSKTLLPENIREEILKSLEQSCDSRELQVTVWKALWRFTKEALPEIQQAHDGQALSLLPLTSASPEQRLAKFAAIPTDRRVICTIGPEAGWSAEEEQIWIKAGFAPVSLGERMLRVETAVCVLLGQIDLLRS